MGSSPKKEKDETLKMERELNEFFEPFFAVFGFESIREKNFPIIDIFENSENIFIEAELPGVDKDSVNVSVVEDELVIEGVKAEDRSESKKVKYICIERSFGKFRRTVNIPVTADTSRVKALYREGVLLITIPKVKEKREKKKKVDIE